MKKYLVFLLLCWWLPAGMAAQWSVKQSEFAGSPLEKIHATSPYLVHVIPDKE